MKTKLKRFLIGGYCWGIFPAWLVNGAFRVFGLRAE